MSALGRRNYIFLFAFLGLIGFAGLFTPLMDNDAAHHANIALRMYLTGDYVNLIDNGRDYLDKPHLHFWLAALSFKLFGVNDFAYKFPSFLLAIGGLISLYKLGTLLYDKEVGRLSALIMGTALAFVISQNDVRMDAILVAAICFSCWQLTEMIRTGGWHTLFSALGLAIGFSVKGSIGVAVPLIYLSWYMTEYKLWRSLLSLRSVLLLLLFLLVISPVLYCYYLQFDLHPEKIIRGRGHVSGLRFALFGGGAERFSGAMSQDGHRDWLFFFYTFLWAFAPWSIITYMGMFRMLKEKKLWFLPAVVLTLAVVLGLAGSKLPHYLNISFPFAALITAVCLHQQPLTKTVRIVLYGMMAILLIVYFLINGWLFPQKIYRVLLFAFLLMTGYVFSHKTAKDLAPINYLLRAALLFYLFLNMNFYPSLLDYQGGQVLAEKTKQIDPGNIYFWKDNYSSSFCFATKSLRKEYSDHLVGQKDSCWLVYDIQYEKEILAAGLMPVEKIAVRDFEITKLDKEFLDPGTREAHCSQLVLAKLRFRKPSGSLSFY